MKARARKALSTILTAALITSMVIPTAAFAKENKEKKQPAAEEEKAQVKPSEPKDEQSGSDNGNKPDEKAKKEEPKKTEPLGQEKEPGKPEEKPKGNSPKPGPEDKPGPKPKENPKPEPSEEPVETITVTVPLHNGQGTTVKCPTRWHFVLVGVGKVFTPGTLTVTFSGGVTKTATAYKVNQQMAHYEVFTTGPTTLVSGSVTVTLEKRYQDRVRLNLSDYAESCPPPSDDDTDCPPPPPPPSDDDTDCPPPSDEETPPVPPKPPTPPTPPHKPVVKPVVRTVEVERAAEAEEFLPFTGLSNGPLYLLAILGFASIGIFLRWGIPLLMNRFRPQPLLQ